MKIHLLHPLYSDLPPFGNTCRTACGDRVYTSFLVTSKSKVTCKKCKKCDVDKMMRTIAKEKKKRALAQISRIVETYRGISKKEILEAWECGVAAQVINS